MSFTYCKLCGHKNLYSVEVPKFCGGCGAPLKEASAPEKKQASAVKRIKRTRPMENVDQHEEEGTDIEHVPQIKNLQYEVLNTDSHARVMKIEDLIPEIEEESSGKKTKRKRKPGRPRKRKQQ